MYWRFYGASIIFKSCNNVVKRHLIVAVMPFSRISLQILPYTKHVQGIEGVPQSLACVSEGGYPEQTLNWYKSGHLPYLLTNCTTESGYHGGLKRHLVFKKCTFTPTKNDDNATFYCESYYSDMPAYLTEYKSVVLQLQRMYSCKIAIYLKENAVFSNRVNNCTLFIQSKSIV